MNGEYSKNLINVTSQVTVLEIHLFHPRLEKMIQSRVKIDTQTPSKKIRSVVHEKRWEAMSE